MQTSAKAEQCYKSATNFWCVTSSDFCHWDETTNTYHVDWAKSLPSSHQPSSSRTTQRCPWIYFLWPGPSQTYSLTVTPNLTQRKVNNHSMGCEAQLAWKCLFTSTYFGGRFWSVRYWPSFLVCDQGACKITSLCMQRLRYVPPLLTSRHTDRQTYRQLLTSLYE